MSQFNLSIIDADSLFSSYLENLLLLLNYQVTSTYSSLRDFNEQTKEKIDIIFVSISFFDKDENLKILNQYLNTNDSVAIFTIDEKNSEFLSLIKKKSCFGYITRPVQIDELKLTIDFALQKKKLTLELKEAKERLNSFIINLSKSVIIVNKYDKITFVNDRALQYLNYTEDELINQPIGEIFKPFLVKKDKYANISISAFKHIRHKIHFSYCLFKTKYREYHITILMMPISHDSGIITEFMINFQDISSSKDEIESHLMFQKSKGRKLLTICSKCKKVFDEQRNIWIDVEQFLNSNEGFDCSHTLCLKCAKETYPDYYNDILSDEKNKNFAC